MKVLVMTQSLLLLLFAANAGAEMTARSCPNKELIGKLPLTDALLPQNNSLIYGFQDAGFTTEVDAVRAAANRFNPFSIDLDTEYIGAILEKNASYYYTAQQGVRGQDQVSLHLRYPGSYHLVSFWHTHGAAAAERIYFSEYDTKVANDTNRAFYLADHSGTLKVFRPNAPTLSLIDAERLGLPIRQGFAEGEIVTDSFGKLVLICTSIVQG